MGDIVNVLAQLSDDFLSRHFDPGTLERAREITAEGRVLRPEIGRLSAEQAEIARLRRQLDKAERRLVTTEAALVIMGKAHDLLDVLTKRSRDDSEHTTR